MAVISPVTPQVRRFGQFPGSTVPEDFDAPLPDAELRAWEIAIKTRLGRLDGGPLLAAWGETLEAMAATALAVDRPTQRPQTNRPGTIATRSTA
ncbi:hypothetical protein [Gordonia sp. NPDC003376]